MFDPNRLCLFLLDRSTGQPVTRLPVYAEVSWKPQPPHQAQPPQQPMAGSQDPRTAVPLLVQQPPGSALLSAPRAQAQAGAVAAPGAPLNPGMATHPLGVLGTDATGYASFDLARLPAPVRAAVTAAMRALTLAGGGPAAAGAPEPEAAIWIYPYGSGGARFDALAQGRFAPDAIVMRQDIDAVAIPDEVRNLGLPSMQDPDLTDWRISPGSFSTNPVGLVGADGCETLLPPNVAVQEFNFYQVVGVSDAAAQPPEVQGALKVGFVNDFRLSWIPIGHALGQILYSVPLAPGESMKLAVIDWTRRDAALRTETTKLDECLVHDEPRDRVISETVKASIDEWQRGGSVTGGLATSSGGSYGGFGVGAAVGGSDAIGGSYSTSSGSRELAGNTVQQLSDNVAQASAASRELYSTVVVQTSQSENETIENRTIASWAKGASR